MRSVVAGALSAALIVGLPATGTSADENGERVATITDERVPESSGLAASPSDPSLLYTINDSDNTAAVYAIDKASGDVVGVTTIGDYTLSDTEALGVGSDGTMWVADIGDNAGSRDDVALYAFPEPGRGDSTVTPTRFPLRYPNGPQDAETILVKKQSRRIMIVSKGITSGNAYITPRRMHADQPNLVRRVRAADPPGLVTDGSFTPDGGRIVLRTYGTAIAYDAKTWKETWSASLPSQQQGESLTVDRSSDSLLVGSEGLPSPIIRVDLPRPERSQNETAPEQDTDSAASQDESRLDLGLKILGALVVVLVVLLGWLLIAARRGRLREHGRG